MGCFNNMFGCGKIEIAGGEVDHVSSRRPKLTRTTTQD
jgi:hypothetical protein